MSQLTADSLTVTGPLKFDEITVKGNTEVMGKVTDSQEGHFQKISVMGPFEAEEIDAESLEVKGPVEVEKIRVKGDTNIEGSLSAKESTFQNITITASEITLEDVTAKNILVKDNQQQQTIYLKGNTEIGKIEFESGKGKVEKDSEVKITDGVKGANS